VVDSVGLSGQRADLGARAAKERTVACRARLVLQRVAVGRWRRRPRSLWCGEMGQLVAASLLILVGIRGLVGVSARWPPGHWSLIVRRGLGVAAIVWGVTLIVLELA